MHYAVQGSSIDMIELCVGKGADVNAKKHFREQLVCIMQFKGV